MKQLIASFGLIALTGVALVPVARAEGISPIFGNATVIPLTAAQNKAVLGKGYYADYYGSYGINFASYAAYLGQYGDYNSAAFYANYAYQAFSAAASYRAAGY